MLLPSRPAELSHAVRVLLLEDERTCAEVIGEYLRSVRGLELRLDVAATLAEARAHLARGAYDLLVVDLHVPDSRGLATLDAMQGSNALVIVITSDNDAELREAVLARGAYDFMHKSRLDRESFERLVRLAAVQADTVRSLRRSQARLQAIVHAERSHQESEERFRLALDNSADMIVIVDRKTMRFVDCNNTVCQLTGYTRQELIAMWPWELLPVTRAELEAAYDAQIADPSKSA